MNDQIARIQKDHKDEWLLIRVSKTDGKSRPVEGELVFHSKNRDDVYAKQTGLDGDYYITYTGDIPKKGFAVAFHARIPL